MVVQHRRWERRTYSLPPARYGIALSWDPLRSVDLDLQAVVIDDHGLILDAVYYNNLVALNGAIGLSGDTLGEEKDKVETIWMNLTKFPASVGMLVFIVAAYNGGRLGDAVNTVVNVYQDWTGNTINSLPISSGSASIDVIGYMKRCKDGVWSLRSVEQGTGFGSHFLDILEPTIGDLIRTEIRGAPPCQNVIFTMQKGAVCDLPQSSWTSLKRIAIGVGGCLPRKSKSAVDIDLSAVLFSDDGEILGAVDRDMQSLHGLCHCGDQFAGSAYSYDELITLDLAQMPSDVDQIIFVLTVRSASATFADVRKLFARLCDQNGLELVRFDIPEGECETGLLVARIFKAPNGRWAVQSIGRFCHGPRWKDAESELLQVFRDTPYEVKTIGVQTAIGKRFSQVAPARLPTCMMPSGDESDQQRASFSLRERSSTRTRTSTCQTILPGVAHHGQQLPLLLGRTSLLEKEAQQDQDHNKRDDCKIAYKLQPQHENSEGSIQSLVAEGSDFLLMPHDHSEGEIESRVVDVRMQDEEEAIVTRQEPVHGTEHVAFGTMEVVPFDESPNPGEQFPATCCERGPLKESSTGWFGWCIA